MKEILININNKIATASDKDFIVNGNGDITARFVFDSEWENTGIKTAVFVGSDGSACYQVLEEDRCAVPVFYNTSYIKVGVISSAVCTSTSAKINCRLCVTDEACGTAPIGEDLYGKLCRMIEDKEASSFPVSINEAGNWQVGDTDTGVNAVGRDYTLTDTDKTEIAERVPLVKVPTEPLYAATVNQMQDTSKAYVNSQTGTFWAYLTTTGLQTVNDELTATANNPYTESARLSNGVPQVSGSYSSYFCTPYIDLSKHQAPFTLHLEGASFYPDTTDSYIRWAVYGADKSYISEHRASAVNGINLAWNVSVTDITVSADKQKIAIRFTNPPALADGTLFSFVKISAKGSSSNARIYISYESETEISAWTDTSIPYAPIVSRSDKEDIAKEVAELVDGKLLSLIGDEVAV